MAANTDNFVVASFALWAGDLGYMESLLREVPPDRGKTLKATEFLEEPEDILNLVAALRLRQLAQKRGEFKRAAEDLADQGLSLSQEPYVLSTAHLRGTISRTGPRNFVLRGYLTSLEFESRFFDQVSAQVRPPGQNVSIPTAVEPSMLERIDKTLGGSWVVTGDPFIQVDVGDMGLIEAEATWTATQMPDGFSPIEAAFRGLLESLDPQASVAQDTGSQVTDN